VVILLSIKTIYLDACLGIKLITIHYGQVYSIPYIRYLKIDKLKKIRLNLILDTSSYYFLI